MSRAVLHVDGGAAAVSYPSANHETTVNSRTESLRERGAAGARRLQPVSEVFPVWAEWTAAGIESLNHVATICSRSHRVYILLNTHTAPSSDWFPFKSLSLHNRSGRKLLFLPIRSLTGGQKCSGHVTLVMFSQTSSLECVGYKWWKRSKVRFNFSGNL